MKKIKLLLVIILGFFLSLNCADDGNDQPNKRMKMSFICNKAEKNTDKKYECRFCGKCFKYKACLPRHEKSHTKKKSFICDYENKGVKCNRAFKQPTDLTRHIRIHTGEKPFACNYENKGVKCNRAFKQPTDLTRHKKIHTGEKPFACNYEDEHGKVCDKAFRRNVHLTSHKERVHLKKRSFACDYEDEKVKCDRTFYDSWGLDKHIKMHIGEKPFVCNYEDENGKCDVAFACKLYLNRHYKKAHIKEK